MDPSPQPESRRARRGSLVRRLLVIAAIAILLPALWYGYRLVSETTGRSLADLRVCGAEAFDERSQRCTEDERGRPIESARFYCTARLDDRDGEEVTGRFSYKGERLQPPHSAIVANPEMVRVEVGSGGQLLPKGPWRCEIGAKGHEISAGFRSGGPAEPIVVGMAACRSANTLRAPVPVCRSDESRRPLRPTKSVTCSATIVGGKGKLVELAFLYGGSQVLQPVRRRASGSVLEFEAHLEAQQKLPAGRYRCRFSAAGKRVALKTFTVRG